MKKYSYILFVLLIFPISCNCFHVDSIGWKPQQKIRTQSDLDVHSFFKQTAPSFQGAVVVTDPLCLMQTAKDVLCCLQSRQALHDKTLDPIGLRSFIPLDQTIATLRFVVDVIEQDIPTQHFRILDPAFLEEHFGGVQWTADRQGAHAHAITLPDDGSIRLTSYGIWAVQGSQRKTKEHDCGIYQLLDESIGKKYTKNQILSGVLERPVNRRKRRALAWVSRQDFEDALMQGTVVVKFPDTSYKILHVHQTNGIAYDRDQKNAFEQERYWFFKDVASGDQAQQQALDRFKQRKEVIFAGDLNHIGLGKLIAVSHINPVTQKHELRLGILADTGGAFDNNLYQLDLFGGFFENKQALKRYLAYLPTATQASILYKK